MSDPHHDDPQVHVRPTEVPRSQANRNPSGHEEPMPTVPGRVVSGSALLTAGQVQSKTQQTSRSINQATAKPQAGAITLPDLPRQPLTPEQQAEAIKRVQAQAEQRVKLGTQLFKAAEATIAEHVAAVNKARQEQSALKQEVQQDVAKSLQTYDQWLGQIDEGFTKSIKRIEDRVEQLEQGCLAMEEAWNQTEQRLETLMSRAEAMVDASRDMLDQCHTRLAARPARQAEPLQPEPEPEPKPEPSAPPAKEPTQQAEQRAEEPASPKADSHEHAKAQTPETAKPDNTEQAPPLKLVEAAQQAAADAAGAKPAAQGKAEDAAAAPPPPASRGVSAFETEPDDTDPDAPEPIRYTQIIEQIRKARDEDDDRPRPA